MDFLVLVAFLYIQYQHCVSRCSATYTSSIACINDHAFLKQLQHASYKYLLMYLYTWITVSLLRFHVIWAFIKSWCLSSAMYLPSCQKAKHSVPHKWLWFPVYRLCLHSRKCFIFWVCLHMDVLAHWGRDEKWSLFRKRYIQMYFPESKCMNFPALVQIMAWHWQGNKPLFEPMMVRLLTHLCITWPQCVNTTPEVLKYANTQITRGYETSTQASLKNFFHEEY